MIYKLCVSETAIYSLKEKQTKKPSKQQQQQKNHKHPYHKMFISGVL